MNDRVQISAAARAAKRRWSALVGTLAAIAALAVVGLAAAPYLFKGATLQSEIAEQVRSTTGLVLKADGPARFALLPQPHVTMAALHFADSSGTLQIDADRLEGEVRLLPLLVGRLEIASATLSRPKLSIDLDGKPMPADSTIGRALRPGASAQANGNQRLGIVTLVDGTAILKSKMQEAATLIEAINVTVDWRNLDAQATLTGTVAFHDIAADVAAWVGQPSSLMRGDHSAIALRIQSLPLDLSANGDFASAPHLQFRGRLSANAPALSNVLAIAGYDATLPAPFANLSMRSDTVIGHGSVDLPNLHLRLDGNDYEGTLAYQQGRDRPALSGTLATEQLSLTPFLNSAPPFLDASRHWSDRKLALDFRDQLDLDLRISATHMRLPFLLVDDAALAVMTRDNRTEVALVEGKAYGGTLKGRASVGVSDKGMSLRAAGSLNDADASALTWDVFGRQLAAGTLSASANLESAGDTPNALMRNLHGWAKGHASDGELSGADLGKGLREVARRRFDSIMPALRAGRTPFETLLFDIQLADGVASIDEARMKGQDSTMTLEGSADIGARSLDLHVAASPPPGDPAAPVPKLLFGVKGPFDQAIIVPDLNMLR